ncbi:MAG: ankyrin repeat domain-containing protein, partial [Pseudomonadota bacterium]
FKEHVPGSKFRRQLYEYAVSYNEPALAGYLFNEGRFEQAKNFYRQCPTLGYKHVTPFYARSFKDILRQCDRHGVDHRTPMNLTPLMAASVAGNVPLVEALLERGADRELTDHLGRNALHWALAEAFREPKFAKGAFAAIYERIAPAAVDVMVGERLVRIDRHLTEYFLFQTLWTLFKFRFVAHGWGEHCAFNTAVVLEGWEHVPRNVLKPERNKRQHLSSVLSRNEVNRDYPYNRRLFKRMATGWYQFNPALAVRRKSAEGENWLPVFKALNLPLVKEFCEPMHWRPIDQLLTMAGIEPPGVPIAGEQMARRQAAEEQERMRRLREAEELRRRHMPSEHRRSAAHVKTLEEDEPAPWGTPLAKRQAVERLRRKIEKAEKRGKK